MLNLFDRLRIITFREYNNIIKSFRAHGGEDMKIAIFTETYVPFINGVVTHVRLLKEGLEQLGHDVLIVTADPTVRRHQVKDGILRCPAHNIKKIYNYGVASPISTNRLRYLIKFRPDIIHIHNEFGVGFFGLQSSIILGVPLVYTIHTMYDDYMHYIAPNGMTNVLNKTMSFYLKRFTNNASAIIGPSAKVEEFCKRHGVLAKVYVIPNCPDINAFNPEKQDYKEVLDLKCKFRISPDDKVLLTVSRIAQEKSMDVLINYFVKCFKNDKNYKLIVVGDGPALVSLKEQARLLEVDDKVLFSGAVPNSMVPNYCHMADAFVSASLSEMFSISMLEAMAAGLPAIIRYDEINKGQVTHGVNGYIYNNEVEFENVIRNYFAMTTDKINEFKQNTISSVSNYDSKELAKQVCLVYEIAQNVHNKNLSGKIRNRINKIILKRK